MSKWVFRYFFDFLEGQERWLNRMAGRGYRLQDCGKLSYVFEKCQPDEYEYAVEYVGEKSASQAEDYRSDLENRGFRTFTKNINVNYSYGKVRWRPYLHGAGGTATSPGTYNRELLILEKRKDGRPFELHTDREEKLDYFSGILHMQVYVIIVLLLMVALSFMLDQSQTSTPLTWIIRLVILGVAVLYLIPTVRYALLVHRIKGKSGVK